MVRDGESVREGGRREDMEKVGNENGKTSTDGRKRNQDKR